MGIDLSKLSPAPVEVSATGHRSMDGEEWCCATGPKIKGNPAHSTEALLNLQADAEFIALAWNFADVCRRCGWSVRMIPLRNQWVVVSELDNTLAGPFDTFIEAWQGAVDYDKKTGGE